MGRFLDSTSAAITWETNVPGCSGLTVPYAAIGKKCVIDFTKIYKLPSLRLLGVSPADIRLILYFY